MRPERAIVIGAGIGGLCAAIALAAAGARVNVIERASRPGGKMREVAIAGAQVDSGPTVLTMPWVFERLFAGAGAQFQDYVGLRPLHVLARHAWNDGARLDLFADRSESADAIGAFAGPDAARGYISFCAEAKRIYDTLRAPFLEASRPNPISLSLRVANFSDLFAIRPFETMSRALSQHFRDPRLHQLFGRYATYCGSSPYLAPATLMLIAHVEQEGVWVVEGGMQRLAEALVALGTMLGVTYRFDAEVASILGPQGRAEGVRLADGEQIDASAIVCNGDPRALCGGLFGGDARRATHVSGDASLSAVTWSIAASAIGFPLQHHSVFFSDDYYSEFDTLLHQRRLPNDPTLYICAQDRVSDAAPNGSERLFLLVNAPPHDEANPLSRADIDTCETNVLAKLRRSGLTLTNANMQRTTPADFAALFPASKGALYGRATHGWAAAFQRPGSRTRIAGLYLAGGSVHPGAGVPMAALSGQLAARALLEDQASIRPSRRAAMPGGTSTRSATTSSTA